MANFTVVREPDGVVTCRTSGFLTEQESLSFAQAVHAQVSDDLSADRNSRILFDNREGAVFSAGALQVLNATLKGTIRVGNRAAVLVTNSLNKVQAKRNMSEGTEVFLSENAARTWLSA